MQIRLRQEQADAAWDEEEAAAAAAEAEEQVEDVMSATQAPEGAAPALCPLCGSRPCQCLPPEGEAAAAGVAAAAEADEDVEEVEAGAAAAERSAERALAGAAGSLSVRSPLYCEARGRGGRLHKPIRAFVLKELRSLHLWAPAADVLFPGFYQLRLAAFPGAATYRTNSLDEQLWSEDKHLELPGAEAY